MSRRTTTRWTATRLPSLALAIACLAMVDPAAASPAPAAPMAEAPPSSDRPAPDPRGVDFDAAVADAQRLLATGDPAGAAARYEEALAARPDSAEATYNLGVARYRQGRYEDAAKAFQRAADASSQERRGDAALAASSLYNRAASHYAATNEQAKAAQRMLDARQDAAPDAGTPSGAAPPVDEKLLEQAIKDAQQSLQGFKDAALANPDDAGARANAEQSGRLLRALQELRKQQEQQKKEQQKKEQEKDQKQDADKDQDPQHGQQDNQKDQQQQQDKQQDTQQQNKQDQGSPDRTQDGQRQEGSKDEERKDQPQKPESKDAPKPDEGADARDQDKKPKDQPQPESKPDGAPQPPTAPGQQGAEPPEMTKDEADRLLQSVRDRERQRREVQRQRDDRRAAARKPAKDW